MPGQGRLGDKANVSADAHGCPGCPHPGTGPAISGSSDVMVNGLPALRVDDVGIHTACCGPNMWQAKQGAPTVFINGKAAFRKNDATKHCGGDGKLIEGSSDVIVGDSSGGGGGGGGGGSEGGGGGGSAASSASPGATPTAAANPAAASDAAAPPDPVAAEAHAQAATLVAAAVDGVPFCDVCQKPANDDGPVLGPDTSRDDDDEQFAPGEDPDADAAEST